MLNWHQYASKSDLNGFWSRLTLLSSRSNNFQNSIHKNPCAKMNVRRFLWKILSHPGAIELQFRSRTFMNLDNKSLSLILRILSSVLLNIFLNLLKENATKTDLNRSKKYHHSKDKRSHRFKEDFQMPVYRISLLGGFLSNNS